MTRDIIVSRSCMVGPNGYFGGEAIDGAIDVSVNFFRPELERREGADFHGWYWCSYEITYGGTAIHACEIPAPDGVSALLGAMVDAAGKFDAPYFNEIDADTKYRDVIPYIDAIPFEWWHDMRIAGTEPMWIADEPVIFQRADLQRTTGRIAIGCPSAGAMPDYPPSCLAWLEGLEGPDDWRWTKYESGSAFQALQLAMASLATRLRAFLAAGGRVLTPAGDADVDLGAMFGPLIAPPPAPAEPTP